jgi:Yip1 domain
METTAPPEKANGLATYLAVIFAPKTAFEQLARTPMWGWAALIGMIVLVAATLISMPEQARIADIAQNQALANMPADQAAQARPAMMATQHLIPLFGAIGALIGVWLVWLVSALLIFLTSLAGGGNAKFSLAWVAALNAGAVFSLVALVNSIILALRGPDSISGPLDAYTLPSLGMLASPDNVKLGSFLHFFNIGYIWGFAAIACGLIYMLKVKPPVAIGGTIVMFLVIGGLLAAIAR